jgi:circadian clock protein KaiC
MDETSKALQVSKIPTGIKGVDDITEGGLPLNRPTLITGYAGSGKTVFTMHFILNGIINYNEPGVFVSLEETESDLKTNMASFGYDPDQFVNDNLLLIENIRVNQSLLYHSGSFDLSPVLIRIEEAINKVGAKRIVIDTFEKIFYDVQDKAIYRQELIRLIHWLKEKEITAVFTAESPKDPYKRTGIEEFVTDCVIHLSHNLSGNIYTRRLHILKYRGTKHGTNEYPFLISETGITVLPVTSVEFHKISNTIITSGIPSLDEKIQKRGFYAGSSILVSGPSGVGKTSFAVSFGINALEKGKRCIIFSYEEGNLQLRRNMSSLGFDLEKHEKAGLLKIVSTRPTTLGVEAHLISIYDEIQKFKPEIAIFDPITDLVQIGGRTDVQGLVYRLLDTLKSKNITIMFTALVNEYDYNYNLGISSLVDNWVRLWTGGDNDRGDISLKIMKIRGMNHARERFYLNFTDNGLTIRELKRNNSS